MSDFELGEYEGMVNLEVIRPMLVERTLKDICKEDAFICGGFARVACSPNSSPIITSDIDIYLLNDKMFDTVSERIQGAMYVKIKENDVSHVYKYTLDESLTINLIKPIQTGHLHTFGDLDAILENFDFTIARVGVYLENGVIKARGDVDFLQDEENGFLRVKNIHCPIAEIARIVKYQQKGYKCPLSLILTCFIDWEGRDDEFRKMMVDNLLTKKELSTEDVAELYKALYID